MPLHDWNKLSYFGGVHAVWMTELVRWIKPRLPPGYRAFLVTSPTLTLGRATVELPDVIVRVSSGEAGPAPSEPSADATEPDVEVATAPLDPQVALFVERDGWLVAAVEIISPRNKDRPDARDTYTSRYVGFLMTGAHLLLVDVLPQPGQVSFADRIAQELAIPNQSALPAPMAVAYRVGDPTPDGGRFLGIWRRPMAVGQTLPTIPLPISMDYNVSVDLEHTYMRAAADAYLT
jgi:hypothetical protein